MIEKTDRLGEARSRYARTLAAEAGSSDPRLEQVFATVPREAFLAPGPWHMLGAAGYVSTPDADPVHLYQNALVAIDAERGINNGEPALHASWISAVAPRPGETVCHVGAGTGYYTTMLAMLVLPGGKVLAYEIEEQLADAARQNLAPYDNVTVIHGNAVTEELPACDIIYVSAGVVAPPVAWLKALTDGGRLIFPWRPVQRIGLAVMATRHASRYAMRIVSTAWFIPCVGASDERITLKRPSPRAARKSRSIVLAEESAPDASATAIYPDLWFSSELAG